jgi:glycosyltransferase involved in cell wall biosynthesis
MPVITSDNVGASDTFVVDDFNGYIFRSGDVNSLVGAFRKIAAKTDEELWKMSDHSIEMSNAITPKKAAHSFMSVLTKAPQA